MGSTPGTKALPPTQPTAPVAEAPAAADPFAFEDSNGVEPKGKNKNRDRDVENEPKSKRISDDEDDRPRTKKKSRDDDDDEDDDRPRSKKKSRDDDDDEEDDRPRSKKKSRDDDDDDEDDRPRSKKKSRDDDDDDEDDRPRSKKKSRDDDDDEDDRPRSKKKSRDDDDEDDRPRSKRKNRDDDDYDDEDDDRPRSKKSRDDESSLKSGPVSSGDPFAFDFNGEPEVRGGVKQREEALPPVVGGDPFSFDAGPVAPSIPENKAKRRDKDEDDEKPRSKKKDRDDDDEKPRSKKKDRAEDETAPAAAPLAGGDLFSFDVAAAAPDPKSESKGNIKKRDRDELPPSKRKGRDEDDEQSNKKDRKRGKDEEDNEEERRYVPPGEQKGSKKTLLIAILLGVGALGALIAAVVVMQKQAKEKEAVEAAAAAAKAKKDEKKDEAPPPVEPPKKDPGKKDPGKKDPTPKDPKDPTPKEPPEPPATMLDLPPSAKLLTFTPASSKPDTALAPRGTPIVLDAPIGKIKRMFAPEKRTEQDVVVVWQSVAGANGKGEKLNVDIHSGQSGARVHRLEIDGDGKEAKCDLSPDGKSFVAASPDGKLTIWSLSDQAPAKTLENYDPYADRPDLKAHGIAGVFFTKAPGRLLTVTTAGAAQLIDPMAKKVIERWSPLNAKLVPNKVVLGKNLAVDDAHSSIVIAVGGGVYQIESTTMKTSWKLELGEVGRHLGIGVLGVPGRIVYAFETNNNGKKERAVLFSLSTDKAPTVYRWPDVAGDPSEAMWVDVTLAVVGAEKGVVYFSGEGFKPLGFAESTTRLSNDANENGHWFTTPDPTGAAMRTLLQQFATDDLMDYLRKPVEGAKNPPTSKLSEKGLVK